MLANDQVQQAYTPIQQVPVTKDQATIRVVCRFRPQNSREDREGGKIVIDIDDNDTTAKVEDYPGNFSFDKIFDWNSNQETVFKYTAEEIVTDVMKGYNGTIFAYGQTGSGKTFTMMGDIETPKLKGITPRIVESIFQTIFSAPETLEFTVKVSFLEIYMEKIRDLLNPINDNLTVHEEKNRGVYVKGLLEVYACSVDEVFEVMKQGQSERVIASTNMNAESSRSHSIFILTITQKNTLDGSTRTGKLYLVDLAGSEKIGKTGATGQTLEEAKKINLSLSALGNCINALTDGKSQHVPFRDSKLTRILQESLGGNSRTTLIINASPSSFNDAETVSTLRFGVRAKSIKCKAKVNIDLSPTELKNLLKKAKIEVSNLRRHIVALEGELSVWRTGRTPVDEERVDLTGRDANEIPDAQSKIDSALGISTIDTKIVDEEDENESFLKRENELQDQLAEKEILLKKQIDIVDSITEELKFYKERQTELSRANNELTSTVNDTKLQLEKITFDHKEYLISMDCLKETNNELATRVEALNAQIQALESVPRKQVVESQEMEEQDIEQIRQQKMAKMMSTLSSSMEVSEKEQEMRATLDQLEYMSFNTSPPLSTEDIEAQHREWVSLKHKIISQDQIIQNLTTQCSDFKSENEALGRRKDGLEHKLAILEIEYEELLDSAMEDERRNRDDGSGRNIEELRNKLESQFNSKKETYEIEISELRDTIHKKADELENTRSQLEKQQMENRELKLNLDALRSHDQPLVVDQIKKDEDVEKMRKLMSQQLSEFDTMKKKLMKDLQDRCEKVVELEISLDEAREQFVRNEAKNASSKTLAQKMAFLERNLEQLTNVQKQLIEQNAIQKKEAIIAERKLSTRNERIQTLESMLQDTQNRLESQNKKYESQISSLREKVQEAKAKQQPEMNASWLYSSKIAKPLRGGGNNQDSIASEAKKHHDEFQAPMPVTPTLSKRSSWYISLLKK